MRLFEYKVKDLEHAHNVPEGFFYSEDCILDNEIRNDIAPEWDYTTAKIVVVGMLYHDAVKVFVAESDDDMDFKRAVLDELQNLKFTCKPKAFNKHMEIGNYKGCFGYEIDIDEIKPFNAKGWNKERFFKVLKEQHVIPDIQIKDVFDGDASKCIENWKLYKETGKFQYLMDIVSHNLNCLMKETVINKHRVWFKKNYKINHKGWLIE